MKITDRCSSGHNNYNNLTGCKAEAECVCVYAGCLCTYKVDCVGACIVPAVSVSGAGRVVARVRGLNPSCCKTHGCRKPPGSVCSVAARRCVHSEGFGRRRTAVAPSNPQQTAYTAGLHRRRFLLHTAGTAQSITVMDSHVYSCVHITHTTLMSLHL